MKMIEQLKTLSEKERELRQALEAKGAITSDTNAKRSRRVDESPMLDADLFVWLTMFNGNKPELESLQTQVKELETKIAKRRTEINQEQQRRSNAHAAEAAQNRIAENARERQAQKQRALKRDAIKTELITSLGDPIDTRLEKHPFMSLINAQKVPPGKRFFLNAIKKYNALQEEYRALKGGIRSLGHNDDGFESEHQVFQNRIQKLHEHLMHLENYFNAASLLHTKLELFASTLDH